MHVRRTDYLWWLAVNVNGQTVSTSFFFKAMNIFRSRYNIKIAKKPQITTTTIIITTKIINGQTVSTSFFFKAMNIFRNR
jgi:hypothetical protein